jgi:ABC-type multidrug transport system ATPase subunit
MLANLKSEGITIIVSTPYMDEALRCDRIALIQNGKLLDIDTPGNIRLSCKHRIFALRHHRKYELLLALKSVPGVLGGEPFGDAMHVTLHPDTTPEQLVRELETKGLAGVTATEIVPGIEDIFLELMKREA